MEPVVSNKLTTFDRLLDLVFRFALAMAAINILLLNDTSVELWQRLLAALGFSLIPGSRQ
jgi:hypothetical protein